MQLKVKVKVKLRFSAPSAGIAEIEQNATPCHDAQVVGPYRDSNPLRLTILAAMSEDYTTAPQHLQLATCDDYSI